jgi:hypothetical protein
MNVRVACAIRFFAGTSVHELISVYGASQTYVYDSVGLVIDAVNTCQQLQIGYPESRYEQRKIARGFQSKSKADIPYCAGAIDGLLIWINKPTIAQCKLSNVGQTKYYCGRKFMYGLNMQAVCDHHTRFLDVSSMYGGSSSDLLAFERTDLYKQLHNESILAPGLCLFGDNAYINTSYMATPYPGTAISPEKDVYNFFHSNLRIISECSFGRLIYRFGILQRKAPQNFSLQKIVNMVVCLCKLHNFCTDKSLEHRRCLDPPERLDMDVQTIQQDGGIEMEPVYQPETGVAIRIPTPLLGHGNHNEGTTQHFQLAHQEAANADNNGQLPREIMCADIQRKGLRRPAPRNRNNDDE